MILFFSGKLKYARLGSTNYKKDHDYQEFLITEYYPNPFYNATAHRNDIAVVALSRKVELNSKVRPVCFEEIDDLHSLNLIATGWGKPSKQAQASDELKVVSLLAILDEECENIYERLDPDLDFSFCAAAKLEGYDTCNVSCSTPYSKLRQLSNLIRA